MWLFSRLTTFLGFILSGLIATAVQAETIDANSGDGFVALNRKIQCSLADSSPQVFEWSGFGYSRVPGEPDRKIFSLLGMNIRQCGQVEDPDKGIGYRLVSREIMLYLDPQTGEILRTFDNPWTGEANEVIHVANDPVNQRPGFGINADGSEKAFTYRDVNGQYLINYEIPLFYKNAMGGDYQKYVGGSDVFRGGSDDACSVELSVECADCSRRTLGVVLSEDNEIIGGQPVNLAKVCRRHTVVS